MGPPTQEMLQQFENVGLAIGDGINEPPDHISLELEYLYFLLDSILKGDPELEDVGEYVTNFMLPWISIFLERLKSEDSQSIYQPITAILIAVLKDIGGRT